MAAPLLIADVPWLLYRSFFALPKSIVGSDGQPVNALLGTVNAILTFYRCAPAGAPSARRGGVHGRRAGGLPRAGLPGLSRPPRPDAGGARRAVAEGAGAARELRLDGRLERGAGGRRRDVLLRARRAAARRPGAAADRRPRPVRRRSASAWRSWSCSRAGTTARSVRPRCESATAWIPSRSRTSSRCAAIPPTACPARRASARRRPPSCCARTARSRPC